MSSSGSSIEEYFRQQRLAEAQYGPDTIVLYECGSFYEMYGVENEHETIGQASRMEELLNIRKTRRNKNIPGGCTRSNPYMLGFPSNTVQKFLNILIQNGWTAVMIEQTTAPPNPERKLTRVLSPSTYIPEQPRPEYQFVVGVYGEGWSDEVGKRSPWTVGLVALDLSTGRIFRYTTHSRDTDCQYVAEDIFRVLESLNPVEMLLWIEPGECPFTRAELTDVWDLSRRKNYWLEEDKMAQLGRLSYQDALLEECFPGHGMESVVEYLDLEREPGLVKVLCMVLEFAKNHNPELLTGLSVPETWERETHLLLHYNTFYQLNMLPDPTLQVRGTSLRSLWDLLDQTATACGKRLLRERMLNPVVKEEWLRARYNRLSQWLGLPKETREEVRRDLKVLGDLERFQRRLQLRMMSPIECSSMGDMFEASRLILGVIQGSTGIVLEEWGWSRERQREFEELEEEWVRELDVEQLAKFHLDGIKENVFHKGRRPQLDAYQDQIEEAQRTIEDLHGRLVGWARLADTKKANESWVKVESNEKEGHYMTITKNRWNQIVKQAPDQHGFIVRPLPSGNNVKLFHPDMERSSQTIQEVGARLGEDCKRFYQELLLDWSVRFREMFRLWALWEAEVDVLGAFARVCDGVKYVKPEIREHPEKGRSQSWLRARNVRHPLVERIQTETAYVPNDISLDGEGLLVFGLNGGGKSSFMKSVGLCVILAQMGMFVPADEFEFWPFTAIYSRIMGTDNLLKGLSSFMIEMQEMRTILREASPRTLVLGDEICRGTEIASAEAIVAAAVESLADRQTNFIFATHLHRLAEMNGLRERENLQWAHIEVSTAEGGVLDFGRKLRPGVGPSAYGLEVARCILGNTPVVERAFVLRDNTQNKEESSKGKEKEKDKGKGKAKAKAKTKEVVKNGVEEERSFSSGSESEDGSKNRRSPRLAARRRQHF